MISLIPIILAFIWVEKWIKMFELFVFIIGVIVACIIIEVVNDIFTHDDKDKWW